VSQFIRTNTLIYFCFDRWSASTNCIGQKQQ